MDKQTKQYAIIGGLALAGALGFKIFTDKRKTAEAQKQQKQQNRPMGNSTLSLLQAGKDAGNRFRSRFASKFGIRGTFGTRSITQPNVSYQPRSTGRTSIF